MRVREESILLRQLAGELKVYTTGTVKLECRNKESVPAVLHLYKIIYVLQVKVNLFNLQKLKKAYQR